ncbi:hypothetical protein N9Y92_04715, partial [Chlamydiales bacterium]|nr:hypothetical protein [Chlamydiales bacterium]
ATASWLAQAEDSIFPVSTYSVLVSTYNGSAWSPPVVLDSGPTRPDSLFDVAMNATSTAVYVWDSPDNDLIKASIYDGSAWSTPENLSLPGQDASDPAVSMDSLGNAIAVWVGSDGLNNITQASIYDGSTWSTPENLSLPGQDVVRNAKHRPQVSSDNLGTLGTSFAVWVRSDGSNDIVQASIYDGSAWSTPENLSLPGQDGQLPQVGSDASGNAIVAWQQVDGTTYTIYASRYDGSAWSTPIALSAPGISLDQQFNSLNLSVNAFGQAIAVWQQSRNVHTATYNDNTWSSAENLSPPGIDTKGAQISLNAAGNAVSVLRSYFDFATIEASTNAVLFPSPLLVLCGKVLSENRLFKVNRIHQICWKALDIHAINSYKIKVGGLTIKTISSLEPPLVEFKNRIPGIPITYEVVALNNNGIELTRSTVTLN